MIKKDDDKIKKFLIIWEMIKKEVYCPFIIFLLNEQITINIKEKILFLSKKNILYLHLKYIYLDSRNMIMKKQ